MRYRKLFYVVIALMTSVFSPVAFGENIDPGSNGSKYAWSENVGWLNFKPSLGPGVTVTNSNLTGYVWGENLGWISLSCLDSGTCATIIYGVQNDGIGNLSGYAWGENVGWINFAPAGGGVAINGCGEFSGYAWGENIGWISFRYDGPNAFKLATSWQSPLDNIPPVTTYSPVLQSWYRTDTVFNFSATDCGPGVKEVRYRINSGTEIITPGSATSATITTEACNMLEYYSIDLANNIEPNRTLAVCIDKTPPVVSISAPANGSIYYINQGSPANFTAMDLLSGIASITSTAPLGSVFNTAAAGSYTFNVTATDNAGNTTPVTYSYSVIFPGNMDPGSAGCQFAWGENIGWINFKPSWGPGVTVTDTVVIGMAWGENIGWIKMNPSNGGVVNDAAGNLSGYAWGENVGWINFRPAGGGVSIGSDGKFTGYAWGENIGWINFSASNSCVKTAWIAPADTIPDPITFINQTNVALNTLTTSNTIAISGINAPSPISIIGGQYSINGGVYTSASGNVNNGDTVTVQLMSSGSYATTTSATLAIGGVSGTFSVTTQNAPADSIPDSFTFIAQTGVALNTLVTSNTITVTGINTPSPISITSGQYSVNGGAFTSVPGGVNSGDSVRVQLMSSGSYATTTSATLTIGGVSGIFSVTTENAPTDTTPDPFAFVAQTNVALNTLVTSNTITVTGINAPSPISITGGSYSINGGAYISAPGNVNNGDSVRVQLMSSESYATTTNATLTIGGVSGTFNVTTQVSQSQAYVFYGFFSPVDNLPIVNSAKAGQALPVKWRLTDSSGTPISDPSSFRDLGSYMINCSSLTGDPTDAIEEYAAGGSGLQYDGDGYWQFNWKTPKTYANQCRTMVLTLGDGSKHKADFKFK